MIYLATSRSRPVADEMLAGRLGCMNTPASNYDLDALPGVAWAADNGAFSKAGGGRPWWEFLVANRSHAHRCLFAVAPDVVRKTAHGVVGDADATFFRSTPYLPKIRALGYPAAFVLQDGARSPLIPWDKFDVLFVGGSTRFKLSAEAAAFAAEARQRGKRTHMGRVNTLKRLRIAAAEGYDSVDGTFHAFGPDINTVRMRRYLRSVDGAIPFPTHRARVT